MSTAPRVCVTGASGYIAGHVVRELLERGYAVTGTVRCVDDAAKTAHLLALPGANERLSLVEADLLGDERAFQEAMKGCEGVFHTASPFFYDAEDPDKELLEPAVAGTKAVLSAASFEPAVERVVVTSSVAATSFAKFEKGHVYSERDWSDEGLLRKKKNWYMLSKTMAERAAWDFVKENGHPFSLVTVNPCLVVGPMLQPSLNTSSKHILDYMDGTEKTIPNVAMWWCDVRDVARVHVEVYEQLNACGRYAVVADSVPWVDVCRHLRHLRPDLPVPSQVVYRKEGDRPARPVPFETRVEELGLVYTPWQKSIEDTVLSLEEAGYLPPPSASL